MSDTTRDASSCKAGYIHTITLLINFHLLLRKHYLMPVADKPNYLWSLFTMKCPRCRRGRMFNNSNAWNLKKVFSMPEKCPECRQPYELEVGFWYGTGYVSYGLSILVLIIGFILWYIFIGMSIRDNRFFWWMGINITLLLILQPWLMRFSRVMYLYFFVKYDPNYKETAVKTFDY